MRDLLLTGFMGTGKSTVGRMLAERYGLRLVDTDEEIERRTGRSIAEIMTADGEPAFRRIEGGVLRSLARQGSGRIIATGGGALLAPENRALFDADQPVVCLVCEPATLLYRLRGGEDRPLLNPPTLQRIADLLDQREEAYAAFPQVDTTERSAAEVANEIAARYPLEQAGEIEFSRHSATRILLGDGLLLGLGARLRDAGIEGQIVLISDTTVEACGHAARAIDSLESSGYRVRTIALPPGEEIKSMSSLEGLYGSCLEASLERSDTVLGLGGGVICDLAGTLAATYMRGVRLVLAPTTLLAQVDAAIGGKVAVDAAGVKNLAGSFYPAEIVTIDPAALRTLGSDLLAAGMAEVVKIALMQADDLLADVEGMSDPEDVLQRSDIIRRAVELKASLVARDPYERGDRMLLNYGHTIGHGIEAASSYQLSHGEAVSAGMVGELRLAVELNHSAADLQPRLESILARMRLPCSAPDVDEWQVLAAVMGDKKRSRGKTRFAVPARAGEGTIFTATEAETKRAIAYAMGRLPADRRLIGPFAGDAS